MSKNHTCHRSMKCDVLDGAEKYRHLAPELLVDDTYRPTRLFLKSKRFFVPAPPTEECYSWVERRILVQKAFLLCHPELEEDPDKLKADLANKALKECYRMYYDAVADLGQIMKIPDNLLAGEIKIYRGSGEKANE